MFRALLFGLPAVFLGFRLWERLPKAAVHLFDHFAEAGRRVQPGPIDWAFVGLTLLELAVFVLLATGAWRGLVRVYDKDDRRTRRDKDRVRRGRRHIRDNIRLPSE